MGTAIDRFQEAKKELHEAEVNLPVVLAPRLSKWACKAAGMKPAELKQRLNKERQKAAALKQRLVEELQEAAESRGSTERNRPLTQSRIERRQRDVEAQDALVEALAAVAAFRAAGVEQRRLSMNEEEQRRAVKAHDDASQAYDDALVEALKELPPLPQMPPRWEGPAWEREFRTHNDVAEWLRYELEIIGDPMTRNADKDKDFPAELGIRAISNLCAVLDCLGVQGWSPPVAGQSWQESRAALNHALAWIVAKAQAPAADKNPRAPDDKEPTPPPDPSFDKEQTQILLALHDALPQLLTNEDLSAAEHTGLSVRTVQQRMKSLIESGLVHRPHGQKKGATLTEVGKKFAAGLANQREASRSAATVQI